MEYEAFIPGLEFLDNLPFPRLAQIYIDCRKLCVDAGRFTSKEHFDSFVGFRVTGEYGSKAAEYVQAAISQISLLLAVNRSIPPSEQTLNEGGFLGGTIAWSHEIGNEKIRNILRGI